MSIFDETEIIHTYTRAEAIRDGELIDVTEEASHDKGFLGGFAVPVAMTRALYAALETIPESVRGLQDVRGRVHDVLFVGAMALRKAQRRNTNAARFSVVVTTEANPGQPLELWIVASLGDGGEPVVTIGYPEDF